MVDIMILCEAEANTSHTRALEGPRSLRRIRAKACMNHATTGNEGEGRKRVIMERATRKIAPSVRRDFIPHPLLWDGSYVKVG